VVATNVAETSLTIDGIRCVIDSGLARIPRYDAHRGLNTLLIEKISRAAADQRAGRAGRTAPGLCLRLWSQDEHAHRPAQELPEIKRLDLAEVALTLKAAGVEDLWKFRWLEAPDERALSRAEQLLADLGALERQSAGTGRITPLGRKMLAFPLHPRYGRMLLAAQEHGCVYQACTVAALTQGRDLLARNADADTAHRREDLVGENRSSDFWLLMRAWEHVAQNQFRPEVCARLGVHAPTARQVEPLLQQFLELAHHEGLDTSRRDAPPEALQRCILIAFNDRVARLLDPTTLRCELVHGRRGTLARESLVRHTPLLVAAEVREVEGRDKSVTTVLSLATAVEADWLRESFPGDITSAQRVFLDSASKRVYAEDQWRFRELAVGTRRVEPPPLDEAARLLADEVLAGRLGASDWDEEVEQWILRLNQLSSWWPGVGLAAHRRRGSARLD